MKACGLAFTRREFVRAALATGLLPGGAPAARLWVRAAPDRVQPGAADWTRFGADLHNTRFNPRETVLGPDNVHRLKVKWTFETDAPIQTTPTVIGNTLFFGTLGGHEYALDANTGRQKWNYFVGYNRQSGAPNQGVRSSCHYVDGRLYFGSGMARVHCLEAETGKVVWETQIDDDPMRNRAQVFCSPTVSRGRVYAGTSSGRAKAVCLDAESGALRWQFHIVADTSRDAGGSIWTAPAVDEKANIVYFTTGSLKSFHPPDPMLFTVSVLACDADTGEILWYYQPWSGDPFDLDFSCHPMILDAVHPSRTQEVRSCVAAGNKAGMFCLNRYTGELLWKAMLTHPTNEGGPRLNSTAMAYNRIFMVSNATGIRGRRGLSVAAALHAYTGDVLWWVSNTAPIGAPVAVANHVFYQGLTDGLLEAIDARTGEQLWKHQFPQILRGGVAIANGHLYTSTGEPQGWRLSRATPGKTYGLFAFSPEVA